MVLNKLRDMFHTELRDMVLNELNCMVQERDSR